MSSEYARYVIDLLSPWGEVSSRAMFGGFGLYFKEQIFAIIADDMLYFKVDDKNISDYKRIGSEPFTYEAKGKKVILSYWLVPTEIIEDDELILVWAEKAFKAGLRASKNKK